jgi:endonuclease YncB( thermonuclease family)
VYLGDENVNAWLVKQGNAWAYRQYSSDADYCIYEQAARSPDRGL